MALGFHKINTSAARSRIRGDRPDNGKSEKYSAPPTSGLFKIGDVRVHPKFGELTCVTSGRNGCDPSTWIDSVGVTREIVNYFWPVKPGYKSP